MSYSLDKNGKLVLNTSDLGYGDELYEEYNGLWFKDLEEYDDEINSNAYLMAECTRSCETRYLIHDDRNLFSNEEFLDKWQGIWPELREMLSSFRIEKFNSKKHYK